MPVLRQTHTTTATMLRIQSTVTDFCSAYITFSLVEIARLDYIGIRKMELVTGHLMLTVKVKQHNEPRLKPQQQQQLRVQQQQQLRVIPQHPNMRQRLSTIQHIILHIVQNRKVYLVDLFSEVVHTIKLFTKIGRKLFVIELCLEWLWCQFIFLLNDLQRIGVKIKSET